ncbi:hypothetical protein Tco_1175580 [Tanacetum coccineum]
MIGILLYLTASRPDIMFSVCLCARFQEVPKTSHLEAVKRIFRYIKGTTHLGLWYPKGTDIETVVYADSDHAGDYMDRKSTSGICTFVGCCLTSWFSKKQTSLDISTTEAEYASARKACQQALWMKQALIDYDIRLNDVPIMCDIKARLTLAKTRCNTRELNTSKSVTTFFVIMSIKDISLLKKCRPSTISPIFSLNPLNVNRLTIYVLVGTHSINRSSFLLPPILFKQEVRSEVTSLFIAPADPDSISCSTPCHDNLITSSEVL